MTSRKGQLLLGVCILVNGVLSLVIQSLSARRLDIVTIHPLPPPMTRIFEASSLIIGADATQPSNSDESDPDGFKAVGDALAEAFKQYRSGAEGYKLDAVAQEITRLESSMTSIEKSGQTHRRNLELLALQIARVIGPKNLAEIAYRTEEFSSLYDAGKLLSHHGESESSIPRTTSDEVD